MFQGAVVCRSQKLSLSVWKGLPPPSASAEEEGEFGKESWFPRPLGNQAAGPGVRSASCREPAWQTGRW